MANYLSTPQVYSPPIATYNFDLIGKALQYKQQQVDVNTAKIQSEIDNYANIDLFRDVDKKYLSDNLNRLVSHVNSLDGADISSQNTSNIIQGHIREAIDSKVVNAAAATRSIRATQSQIEDVKTNHPERWGVENEWAAFKGIDDYMANPEAGAKYSAAGYTPYVDVNAQLKPYLENLQDHVPGIKKMHRGDGDLAGYFVTEEGKELSPREVRAVAQGLLGSQAKTQLQITGMYNYTRGDAVETSLRPAFESYKNKRSNGYESEIKNNEIKINSTFTTEQDKEFLRNTNDALKTEYSTFKTQVEQIAKSPDQMAYSVQEDNFLNSVGNQYKVSEVNETLSSDTSYWANKNYELETLKFEYQKSKDTASNLTPLRLVTPTTPEEEVRTVDNQYTDISTEQKKLQSFISAKLSDPDMIKAKIQWESDYEKLPEDKKKGLTKDVYLSDRLKDSGKLGIKDLDVIDGLTQTINSKTQALINHSDAVEQESEEEKLPSAIAAINRNPSKQMVDPSNPGKRISMAEYLRKTGVTEDNILSPENSTVRNEIVKALYAENIVAEESTLGKIWGGVKGAVSGFFNSIPTAGQSSLASAAVQSSLAYQKEEERQTGKARRRIARLNGEDFISEDTPKTNEYLSQVRKLTRPAARTGFLPIYNPLIVHGENIASEFTDTREYNKRLAARLVSDETLVQTGNFAVNPKSAQFQEVFMAINGSDASIANKINKDMPINIRQNPSDPASVIVTQYQKEGKTSGKVEIPIYLQNVPTVAASLNFNNQRPVYTQSTFKGLNQPVKILSQDDTTIIHDIAENVYMRSGLDVNTAINTAKLNNTKEGITHQLNKVYSTVINNPDGSPTKYGSLVNTVLSDKNLKVEVKPSNLGVTLSINKGDNKIYSSSNIVLYKDLEPILYKVKYTPSEIVGEMLEQMVQEKAQFGTEQLYNKLLSKYSQQ